MAAGLYSSEATFLASSEVLSLGLPRSSAGRIRRLVLSRGICPLIIWSVLFGRPLPERGKKPAWTCSRHPVNRHSAKPCFSSSKTTSRLAVSRYRHSGHQSGPSPGGATETRRERATLLSPLRGSALLRDFIPRAHALRQILPPLRGFPWLRVPAVGGQKQIPRLPIDRDRPLGVTARG